MVNFDRPSYSIMEGDAVVVSITLSQSLSMNIEVDVNTMDVTATGRPSKVKNRLSRINWQTPSKC